MLFTVLESFAELMSQILCVSHKQGYVFRFVDQVTLRTRSNFIEKGEL
jgi:hypothetical protein